MRIEKNATKIILNIENLTKMNMIISFGVWCILRNNENVADRKIAQDIYVMKILLNIVVYCELRCINERVVELY